MEHAIWLMFYKIIQFGRIRTELFIDFFLNCFVQTLIKLNLGYNQLGAEGARHIACALRKNTVRIVLFFLFFNVIDILLIQTLKELFLNNNSIGNVGAEYMADTLKENTVRILIRFVCCSLLILQTLTTLSLSETGVGKSGAYFGNVLRNNTVNKIVQLSFVFE